jgi:hypothetical protein
MYCLSDFRTCRLSDLYLPKCAKLNFVFLVSGGNFTVNNKVNQGILGQWEE